MLRSDKYGGDPVHLVVATGRVIARLVDVEKPAEVDAANNGLNEAGMHLRTPLVSAQARGTSLLLGYDQDTGSRLLVNDGIVGLRLNANSDMGINVVVGMKVEEITDLTFRLQDHPLPDDEWIDLDEEIQEIPVTANLGNLLRDFLTGGLQVADLARLRRMDSSDHDMDEQVQRRRKLLEGDAVLVEMTEEELEELLSQLRALGYDETDLFLDAETFQRLMTEVTAYEMKNIARGIEIMGRIPGEAPSDLRDLEMTGAHLTDAWGIGYDFVREPGRAVLRSADPDREFDTDDDLVRLTDVR